MAVLVRSVLNDSAISLGRSIDLLSARITPRSAAGGDSRRRALRLSARASVAARQLHLTVGRLVAPWLHVVRSMPLQASYSRSRSLKAGSRPPTRRGAARARLCKGCDALVSRGHLPHHCPATLDATTHSLAEMLLARARLSTAQLLRRSRETLRCRAGRHSPCSLHAP
jgi:hypothetical protein